MMLMGWGILALPMGVVTAELANQLGRLFSGIAITSLGKGNGSAQTKLPCRQSVDRDIAVPMRVKTRTVSDAAAITLALHLAVIEGRNGPRFAINRRRAHSGATGMKSPKR